MTCAQVSLHQECRNDKNIGGFSSLPNRSANPNKHTNYNKNRVHMHKTRIKNGSSGGIFSLMPASLFSTLELCPDHVISTGRQMKNSMSNFEYYYCYAL